MPDVAAVNRRTAPKGNGGSVMVSKVLALIALVALPFSLIFWYRSHANPVQYRSDVTPYRSLRVYLKDGTCGMNLLSMPTKASTRGEFRATLQHNPPLIARAFSLQSRQSGPYHTMSLVFPLWVVSAFLSILTMTPVVQGPGRRWWRSLHGWCLECGYDLRGNRSGRCSECGTRYR